MCNFFGLIIALRFNKFSFKLRLIPTVFATMSLPRNYFIAKNIPITVCYEIFLSPCKNKILKKQIFPINLTNKNIQKEKKLQCQQLNFIPQAEKKCLIKFYVFFHNFFIVCSILLAKVSTNFFTTPQKNHNSILQETSHSGIEFQFFFVKFMIQLRPFGKYVALQWKCGGIFCFLRGHK